MKHVVLGLALAIVAHHSNRPVKAMTIEAGQEEDSDYAIRGSIMTDKDEKEESNRKARLFWGVSQVYNPLILAFISRDPRLTWDLQS